MALHIITLILLSLVTHSYFGVVVILILWSFAAWSTCPTQQYHLATIEPELLGINQSMMQLAMAVGAGIGGIFVEKFLLAFIPWIGANGVVIAIIATLMAINSNFKQKSKPLKNINQ